MCVRVARLFVRLPDIPPKSIFVTVAQPMVGIVGVPPKHRKRGYMTRTGTWPYATLPDDVP